MWLLVGVTHIPPLSEPTRLQPTTPTATSIPLPTELQEAQQDIWSSCWSKDTLRVYGTQRAKWMEFCTRFQRSLADLSPSNLIDYITYLASIGKTGSPLAYSTIKAYLDFLGRAMSYMVPGAPNPVCHPEVQLFLRGTARRLGKKVEKAEPCQLDHLRALTRWALQNLHDLTAQTVAMVALFAFWGCLRLGSLVPKTPDKLPRLVCLGDVRLLDSAVILVVRASKTIQFADRTHPVELPAQEDPLLCPRQAFNRWILLSPPRSSQTPLCALSSTTGKMLSHSKFVQLVNLHTRPLPALTGHSFRRGFVRMAFIRGVPIWQIMHHGDWKTLEVAMAYAEDSLMPNPLGVLPREEAL